MINERFKEAMDRKGVSQKALAETLGMPAQTVSYNLKQAYPPIEFLIKGCKAIDYPIRDLFDEGTPAHIPAAGVELIRKLSSMGDRGKKLLEKFSEIIDEFEKK